MAKICSTCLCRIENDDAPVLTMGAYGTPKLLCDGCAALVETMTTSKDYDEIAKAMSDLTDVIAKSNADDRVVVQTVTELLESSAKRAQQIKEGTYDFSLDETDDGIDEIPEYLQESEEDRLLDEQDAEANAKFEKILNWLWIAFGVLAGAAIIWRVVTLLF